MREARSAKLEACIGFGYPTAHIGMVYPAVRSLDRGRAAGDSFEQPRVDAVCLHTGSPLRSECTHRRRFASNLVNMCCTSRTQRNESRTRVLTSDPVVMNIVGSVAALPGGAQGILAKKRTTSVGACSHSFCVTHPLAKMLFTSSDALWYISTDRGDGVHPITTRRDGLITPGGLEALRSFFILGAS